MFQLDIRTIIVLNLVVSVVISLLGWQLWRQNRKAFLGMDHWSGYFALQTLGLALIAVRGKVDDLLSVVVGNVALTLGLLAMRHGLRAFVAGLQHRALPAWPRWSTVVVALIGAEAAYFTFVEPNLVVRIVAHSGVAALVWLDCLRLLLRPATRQVLPQPALLAAIVAAHAAINLVRIAALWLDPPAGADQMGPSGPQAAFMVATLATALALVGALVLTMNQLLIAQAHAERDKFRGAFLRAPFAISVTRLADQQFLEVNDTFERFSGYRRDELLGHTAIELGLWADPAARATTIAELADADTARVATARFVRKSGAAFDALVSLAQVTIDGAPAVIACIADVSEQQRAHIDLAERETELRNANRELLRFNRAAVGRELDMVRLKREVNALSEGLGRPPPYAVVADVDIQARPSLDSTAAEG